ncbi:forkhead box protein O1 isoform X1 [Hydra vulgaris]|uniref:forkhead box protein O1 isoform X1 n=1 Tax=Hydra vulgaris TaxID=6087 RepID=UPI001F5E589C|nr:forkhead box protein O1 isoform X1 [Hydra vulgaris]XP_047127991.1 forkhead box protein O1 isoform X1 [Hydra vulgaris]
MLLRKAMDVDVELIYDDSPTIQREDRPRSRTWPILPSPIETIHENDYNADIGSSLRPAIIEEKEVEEDASDNFKKNEQNPRKISRKNAWGNLSYADLICQAIQASPDQRLTLSQIYDWMVRNISYFKDKGDSTSSAGWKNSIRHNLSLHSRFMRVQNDTNGKSSYWVINPDAKAGKSSRRRAGSVDGQPKEKNKRVRTKKHHQSIDDITSLSPANTPLKQNHSYENLLSVSSPCSSTDSLSNVEEISSERVCSPNYASSDINSPYTGDSFARPRSTSTVSVQSNINPSELEDDLKRIDQQSVISFRVDDESSDQFSLSSINLDDSMKKITEKKLSKSEETNFLLSNRQSTDSFTSNDSGYDGSVYFSPHSNFNRCGQNLPMISSPNSITPFQQTAYNPGFPMQVRDINQNSYFMHQQFDTTFNGDNFVRSPSRLKHYDANKSYNTLVNNISENCSSSQSYISKGQRVNLDDCFYSQNTLPSHNVYDMLDTIPSDLDHVKLYSFEDPHQLAIDLNQIIENDLKGSSTNLKSLCEPIVNNNTSSTSSDFIYQNWVR